MAKKKQRKEIGTVMRALANVDRVLGDINDAEYEARVKQSRKFD